MKGLNIGIGKKKDGKEKGSDDENQEGDDKKTEIIGDGVEVAKTKKSKKSKNEVAN